MLYQTYSELDLVQLENINQAVKSNAIIPTVEIGTVLSTFEGHTLFTLYYENINVYQRIQEQLTAMEFPLEKYSIK